MVMVGRRKRPKPKPSGPNHYKRSCPFCDISVSSVGLLVDHVRGFKHTCLMQEHFPEQQELLGRLQYFMDTYVDDSDPLLGLEYIQEAATANNDGAYAYVCELCDTRGDWHEIFMHIISDEHMYAYIDRHCEGVVPHTDGPLKKKIIHQYLKKKAMYVQETFGRKQIKSVDPVPRRRAASKRKNAASTRANAAYRSPSPAEPNEGPSSSEEEEEQKLLPEELTVRLKESAQSQERTVEKKKSGSPPQVSSVKVEREDGAPSTSERPPSIEENERPSSTSDHGALMKERCIQEERLLQYFRQKAVKEEQVSPEIIEIIEIKDVSGERSSSQGSLSPHFERRDGSPDRSLSRERWSPLSEHGAVREERSLSRERWSPSSDHGAVREPRSSLQEGYSPLSDDGAVRDDHPLSPDRWSPHFDHKAVREDRSPSQEKRSSRLDHWEEQHNQKERPLRYFEQRAQKDDCPPPIDRRSPDSDRALKKGRPHPMERRSPHSDRAVREGRPHPMERRSPHSDRALREGRPHPIDRRSPVSDRALRKGRPHPMDRRSPHSDRAVRGDHLHPMDRRSPDSDRALRKHAHPMDRRSPHCDRAVWEGRPYPMERRSPRSDRAFRERRPHPIHRRSPDSDRALRERRPHPMARRSPHSDRALREGHLLPMDRRLSPDSYRAPREGRPHPIDRRFPNSDRALREGRPHPMDRWSPHPDRALREGRPHPIHRRPLDSDRALREGRPHPIHRRSPDTDRALREGRSHPIHRRSPDSDRALREGRSHPIHRRSPDSDRALREGRPHPIHRRSPDSDRALMEGHPHLTDRRSPDSDRALMEGHPHLTDRRLPDSGRALREAQPHCTDRWPQKKRFRRYFDQQEDQSHPEERWPQPFDHSGVERSLSHSKERSTRDYGYLAGKKGHSSSRDTSEEYSYSKRRSRSKETSPKLGAQSLNTKRFRSWETLDEYSSLKEGHQDHKSKKKRHSERSPEQKSLNTKRSISRDRSDEQICSEERRLQTSDSVKETSSHHKEGSTKKSKQKKKHEHPINKKAKRKRRSSLKGSSDEFSVSEEAPCSNDNQENRMETYFPSRKRLLSSENISYIPLKERSEEPSSSEKIWPQKSKTHEGELKAKRPNVEKRFSNDPRFLDYLQNFEIEDEADICYIQKIVQNLTNTVIRFQQARAGRPLQSSIPVYLSEQDIPDITVSDSEGSDSDTSPTKKLLHLTPTRNSDIAKPKTNSDTVAPKEALFAETDPFLKTTFTEISVLKDVVEQLLRCPQSSFMPSSQADQKTTRVFDFVCKNSSAEEDSRQKQLLRLKEYQGPPSVLANKNDQGSAYIPEHRAECGSEIALAKETLNSSSDSQRIIAETVIVEEETGQEQFLRSQECYEPLSPSVSSDQNDQGTSAIFEHKTETPSHDSKLTLHEESPAPGLDFVLKNISTEMFIAEKEMGWEQRPTLEDQNDQRSSDDSEHRAETHSGSSQMTLPKEPLIPSLDFVLKNTSTKMAIGQTKTKLNQLLRHQEYNDPQCPSTLPSQNDQGASDIPEHRSPTSSCGSELPLLEETAETKAEQHQSLRPQENNEPQCPPILPDRNDQTDTDIPKHRAETHPCVSELPLPEDSLTPGLDLVLENPSTEMTITETSQLLRAQKVNDVKNECPTLSNQNIPEQKAEGSEMTLPTETPDSSSDPTVTDARFVEESKAGEW